MLCDGDALSRPVVEVVVAAAALVAAQVLVSAEPDHHGSGT